MLASSVRVDAGTGCLYVVVPAWEFWVLVTIISRGRVFAVKVRRKHLFVVK